MHQLVDMTTDELVRRYSRKAPQLLISDDIMGLTNSSSWVLPNTLPDLALPFGANDGRSNGWWRKHSHHLRRKGWGNRSLEQGQRGRPFELSFAKFTPFGIRGQRRQRLVFHALQTSVLILALPSCHLYKRQTLDIIKILPRHKKCIIVNIRKLARYSKRNK